MTTAIRTFWRPEPLTAAIYSAFPPSVQVTVADANARLHEKQRSSWKAKQVSPGTAVLEPEGLASVFERGRRGGYKILPTGKALKFGAGEGAVFAAHAVGGPMRSYPAAGPAARDWALGGFHAVARGRLAQAGFPPGRALR